MAVSAMWMVPAANAQAAPPASGQAVETQQGGSTNQIQGQQLSPQGQAELAKKVVHAILMQPYYGVFDSLGYRIDGRTVILTGQVVNPILRPDVENAVKKIEGVDKVINNIEVLPPGPMDNSVRQAVYRAIYEYGPFLKYKNQPVPPIRIIVKNSRVTLEGIVDNETDKNLCTLRANQVSGALSVTNNLRVIKPNK